MDESGKHFDDDRISMISQCSQAVADLEKNDITEFKSFANPPQAVIDVMTSAMILLGHTGAELDWSNVKKYIGQRGHLQNQVKALDFESISPKTRSEAMNVISKYSKEQIKNASKAIVTLYEWVVAIAEQ